MKKIFIFFCSVYCYLIATPLIAGDQLRAGHIQITQLSATTIQADVVLVVEGHVDLSDVALCWGDGACSNFPALSPENNTAWTIRTYTITTQHSYNQIGTFTVSLEHCCFDGTFINLIEGDNSNFYIETMIVLQDGQLNTTPTYTGNNVFGGAKQTVVIASAHVADPEGDTYLSTLCVPDNVVNYVYPDEIAGFPTNVFEVTPETGGVLWGTPLLDGIYLAQTCTEERRNGELISISRRIICFLIGEEYVTDVTALNQSGLSLYPNPISEGVLYLNQTGNTSFAGAKIKLINSLQQVIYKAVWDSSFDRMAIPVDHLSNGHYFLFVEMKEGNVYYQQVVVGE